MKTILSKEELIQIRIPDVTFVTMTSQDFLLMKEEFSDSYLDYRWKEQRIQIHLYSRGNHLYIQHYKMPWEENIIEDQRYKVSQIMIQIKEYILQKSTLRLKLLTGEKQFVMDWAMVLKFNEYNDRIQKNYPLTLHENITEYIENAKTIERLAAKDLKQDLQINLRVYGLDGLHFAKYLHQYWDIGVHIHGNNAVLNFSNLFRHPDSLIYLYYRFQEMGYTVIRDEEFESKTKILD